jgi:putative transposase
MAEKTELPVSWFIRRLGIQPGKFYDWRTRYGKVNEHNQLVPRDHWIEPWEREAILRYRSENPLEGYRRLSFMMIDAEVVAVSPSTVYRVLSAAGVLDRWSRRPSKKGTGFDQPLRPHEHWHTDISYLNLGGTFYYLCSVLDGYSRKVLHWEIRESMKEREVEIVIQRAREKYPKARPRIISDNGPQFIGREFKLFIREAGMTHVRTSPYHPQSNGKIERWHQTIKVEAIRPGCPSTKEEAETLVARHVYHYNHVRLHSAIGYITPDDKLAGREEAIWAERDRRLEAAREARRQKRLCA